MKTPENSGYVKRTQKDYSISFKLQVVQEIESGQLDRSDACHKYGIQARSTITQWLRKYGTFDWENPTKETVDKTPEQRILELEAKVKLLEKQKARAE
ncbi:transposase, partial [Mariniflexile sp. HNIBRBA6329]|uniref:transposase n=1 Tax=Mariniflexile sp. HNIBRBA6329 TaxID=3373088 RepID=UPI00374730BC